jgi:curli biogenesis system outer membrane secretion channel CsgG
MRRRTASTLTSLLLLASLVLAACGKHDDAASSGAAGAASATASNVSPPMPDVGKLEMVKVSAEGFGNSAAEAVGEALKLAILQVNGASISVSTLSVKYGLDVTLGQDSASLRANAFAEAVSQRSGGVVQNFHVVDIVEPSDKSPRFKADIEANIAKFSAPESMKKVKLVVGSLTFDSPMIAMGDKSMSAAEVSDALHQRIVAALTNTGRFAVLDRDPDPAVQRELDLIASGQAPSAETAKLGQAASADLVWSARVASFAYDRHARKLQTSDRELVSYSGGWTLTEKLVNVATRQVSLSQSLSGEAPATEPTTLGMGVDSNKMLADMSTDLVGQVVASVIQQTFPISVVARDGTSVVLSQGGQAMHEGSRYAVVLLGQELKDPQTGQSLGRSDSPCCDVLIDRVTPNLAYGHLQNVTVKLDALPAGGLQVGQEMKPSAAIAKVADADAAASTASVDAIDAPRSRPARAKATQAPPADATEPEKKW